MSQVNSDTSDIQRTSYIQKAAEQADSQQIEQNLQNGKPVDVPASLTEEEETPFIDDELRTDK